MFRRLASASNSLFKLKFAAFLGACVLYAFLMIITYAYLWCALSIGAQKAYNKQFNSDSPRLAGQDHTLTCVN